MQPNCQRADICSNDVNVYYLRMWACPPEPYCGDVMLTPSSNGSIFNISLNTTSSYKFITNKMCKYLISFPDIAGLTDYI